MPLEPELQWIIEHPELLKSILANSSGAIGELWTARRLQSKGYSVRPTNNNSRQRDLVVTSPMGRIFHLEVKTVRTKGSPFLVRQCPDPAASAFWIFVHAPRSPFGLPRDEDVTYFVLTCEEAAKVWRTVNQTPSSAPDIRWAHLRTHIDRWDKLPA